MTERDGAGGLARWKWRLLDRLRDLASECSRFVNDRGMYAPWPQKEDPAALEHFYARYADLSNQMHDLAARARASGISSAHVDLAGNVSRRGYRRSPVLQGEEEARAQLIDAIADDIWTVEHMAAMAVDLQLRYRRNSSGPRTPEERQHYERRMSMIWKRAADTASIAGLSAGEQAELWGRDQQGWSNLFGETIYGYGLPELEHRWLAHVDPDTETGVADVSAAVALDLAQSAELETQQPSVQVLIDRVTEELNAEIDACGSKDEYDDYRLDCLLGLVLPNPALTSAVASSPQDTPRTHAQHPAHTHEQTPADSTTTVATALAAALRTPEAAHPHTGLAQHDFGPRHAPDAAADAGTQL